MLTRYTRMGYESMDTRRGSCAFALIVGRASAAAPTIVGMRVARLFRFPVKGFPAEELTEARVVKGRGIRGDRVAAFTNGSLDVPDVAWHSYSASTVLKNDTALPKWRVAVALAEAAD